MGSQTPPEKEGIYTIVEEMAEYPGGTPAMMKFIQDNIKYPEKIRDLGIGGKVFLKFIVDETGKISNTEVIKGTGVAQLDEEATRVVQSMPVWKPGRQQGRNVKVYYNLPINFSLSSPYMVFNNGNTNKEYIAAKQVILDRGDLKSAVSIYEAMDQDMDCWFNLGVIYFMENKKREAKACFEKVRDKSENKGTQIALLSEKFLSKYF